MKANEIKFEVGKVYKFTWYGDMADTDVFFKVVSRTAKGVSVTMPGREWVVRDRTNGKDFIRRRVEIMDGEEIMFPFGKYSCAPMLRAAEVA